MLWISLEKHRFLRTGGMIALSVNVNKIATLRNSRGGDIPDVLTAVDTCVAAGAQGITVHPREDERHITPKDVTDIAERLKEINTQKNTYNRI